MIYIALSGDLGRRWTNMLSFNISWCKYGDFPIWCILILIGGDKESTV